MKIVIGSDHGGYALKEELKKFLEGNEIIDVGTNSDESVDYPIYAQKVAKVVASDKESLGILICGTGLGVSMAANKVNGISQNGSYTCTFVNALPTATFKVTKDFSDNNPMEVAVTLSCDTGQILDQTKMIREGTPVTFVVTDFEQGKLDCKVTEEGLTGYTASYINISLGLDPDLLSCRYTNVVGGNDDECRITNILPQLSGLAAMSPKPNVVIVTTEK